MKDFIYLPIKESRIDPFNVRSLEDFKPKPNYPNCCKSHKQIYDNATKWFEKFPDCCDDHRKMKEGLFGFDKSKYEGTVQKIMNQLAYTEHCIASCIDNEDWHKDITDYLEVNIDSFGYPAIGIQNYTDGIKHFIKYSNCVPQEKKVLLLKFITPNTVDLPKPEPIDVPLVIATYERWLDLFPFELPFFKGLKDYFSKQYPILAGEPVVNKYSGMATSKLISYDGMVAFLHDRTRQILKLINTVELNKAGLIKDSAKIQVDILNEHQRLRQETLLTEYAKGEMKYIRTIKNWLRNEKIYFKELAELVRAETFSNLPVLPDTLREELYKYGFGQLAKIKALPPERIDDILQLISEKTVPYKVAMLSYLGFVEYAVKYHTQTKFKLEKDLAKMLETTARNIKGNLNVLSTKSTENKKRYTAHLHQQEVEKDYQNIK